MNDYICTEYYQNISNLIPLFSSFMTITFFNANIPKLIMQHVNSIFRYTYILSKSFYEMNTPQNHYIVWTPYNSHDKDILIILPNTILENATSIIGYHLIFYHVKCDQLKFSQYNEYNFLDNLYVYVHNNFESTFKIILDKYVNINKNSI